MKLTHFVINNQDQSKFSKSFELKNHLITRHMYEVRSKNNHYFQVFQKVFIYLSCSLQSNTLRYNILMPAFFPILKTLLERTAPTGPVSPQSFSFSFRKRMKSAGAKSGEYGG